MSTYFHITAGAAIAVGSRKAVNIELWSGPFFIWMLILILASNMADKDVLWMAGPKRWATRSVSHEWVEHSKAWCLKWFEHRMFFHSIIALMFDLKVLVVLTWILQSNGYLPNFNPTAPLLIALVLHLAVDAIDGSPGVALFAPSSDWMLKLPALFKDHSWEHMVSPDPLVRREFWFKVKMEGALVAGLFLPAALTPRWF